MPDLAVIAPPRQLLEWCYFCYRQAKRAVLCLAAPWSLDSFNMVKKQKEEETDPDPTPYLFVSLEQKRIDQTKPYDAKKACWVPDEAEGFLQGEIKATKGEVVTVILPNGEVSLKGLKPWSSQGLIKSWSF